jgi:hypothetical protein
MDAIQKYARARPGSGHRAVLTNPVRCCSAFAHTSTSPTSLDSRCSAAVGPEPEAPDNGQAIETTDADAGQAAAPIHRTHHSNERPVGGAKIGHAEEPVSAAGTVLSPCYLLPPARTRARVINYWHQGANVLPATRQRPCSRPPAPSEITRKIRPEQPEDAMWFPLVFAQSKLAFWRNVPNGH